MVSVALGADKFDCVYPSRTARFGNAITKTGTLKLKNSEYANDFRVLEEGCGCVCCRPRGDGEENAGLGVTRAFIHHNVAKETVAAHLLTMHNVWYMLNLMKEIREAIIADRYPAFIREFFASLYPDRSDTPEWAVGALKSVGLDIMEN